VLQSMHGKNGFVTATKLGTTNEFFLLHPKILLQQPNVLLIELNILLLWQSIFVITILTNDFVSVTKPFFPCGWYTLRYEGRTKYEVRYARIYRLPCKVVPKKAMKFACLRWVIVLNILLIRCSLFRIRKLAREVSKVSFALQITDHGW